MTRAGCLKDADLEFRIVRDRLALRPSERAKLLEEPKFGQVFTDHMVTVEYQPERGWHSPQVRPLDSLRLHPATAALHYAQEVFEGLKAHRRADGGVSLFRADRHAVRFNRSLRRMAMPEFPEQVFLRALHLLVGIDAEWVPPQDGASLYLRPFMFATDTALGAGHPSGSYLFVVIASPSGNYFGARADPIKVWVSDNYVRAAVGGTGAAKAGANYAGALLGLQEAADHGCDQAVWLDAAERRWVEEAGAMNLFFVLGEGDQARLVTPELTGTFLPGITRESILELAPALGVPVSEERVSVQDWERLSRSGKLSEAFACGTASVIVGIGEVCSAAGSWTIGSGAEGPVTTRLRQEIVGIQRGVRADTFGWTGDVDLAGTPASCDRPKD
jgi:branched-chain amino acid aminotransferase